MLYCLIVCVSLENIYSIKSNSLNPLLCIHMHIFDLPRFYFCTDVAHIVLKWNFMSLKE